MTDYKTPGVYVNEIPPAAGPMQGASTSVAAFVGAVDLAAQSVVFSPPVQAFTNFTQFKKAFASSGGPAKTPTGEGFSHLANAVFGFFTNGGTRCFVTIADTTQSTATAASLVTSIGLAMTAAAEAAPSSLSPTDAAALVAAVKTALPESVTAKQARDVKSQGVAFIAASLRGVVVDAITAASTPEGEGVIDAMSGWSTPQQADLAAAMMTAANGAATLWNTERLAPRDLSTALSLLEPFEEISIVAAPGSADAGSWSALQTHCETFAPNRFAILDCPGGTDWATAPPKSDASPPEMPQRTDHRVSAIYFPWIKVTDPLTNLPTLVPPSGHMAGVYARVDAQRGVFKAPANVSVNGALDLAYRVSSRQQQELNDPLGINCIRQLNGGILVWGARTVQAPDGDAFTYISSRRTFNYIRASLEQSTQWAVFEPNTQALWGQIIRNVTTFLKALWQSGGLFGATAAEAFYVKCDEENNPPDVRALGQVVTEIGVAITTPAEFVVFNLGVMTQAPGAAS
jgi:Bacteriophage tail sheath protein